MRKLLLASCLFLVLGINQSSAGLLLEPYLGYGLGMVEGVGVDDTVTGSNFGARVGYQTFGLMLGGVYEMTPSSTRTNTITDAETDYGSRSMIGVFAGYDFPLFVRAWASYYLNISSEDKDGNDTSDSYDSATSVGVGLTFLPFVSLNIEYRMIELAGSSSSFDSNEILASVSLPLNL